jgi:hypothetical protein
LKDYSDFRTQCENGSIGSVRTVGRLWRSRKSARSGQKVKREFSLGKIIFQ